MRARSSLGGDRGWPGEIQPGLARRVGGQWAFLGPEGGSWVRTRGPDGSDGNGRGRFRTLGSMVRIVAALLIAYLVVRTLMVLALGDVFFYGEELEKGAVSLGLLGGTDVSLARLPYHPYEGGGFVASWFKLPFFWLLGPCVLAHKAAAITWGLLILGVTVGFVGRHAGRGAACLAGGLLIFGPAHFQRESLLHLGIHFEGLLWMALIFDLGLRLAATPRGQAPARGVLVGLGLASGFGTYFSYQVPFAVLAVIGLLAWTDWRRIFSPALVLSTLAGLLPLAWMALSVGAEIVDIHGAQVGEEGGAARLFSAIGAGLSSSLARTGVALGALASIAGLMAAPPGRDRARALGLLLSFALLWVLVAAVTGMVPGATAEGHWVQFVRFAPLVYACLLLVAMSAGPALRLGLDDGSGHLLARLAAAGLLGLGLVHSVRIVAAGDPGSASANLTALLGTSGVELRGAFVKLVPRLEDPDEPDPALRAARAAAQLAGLQDPRSDLLSSELAAAAAQQAVGATSGAVLEALVTELPHGHSREALELGLGPAILREHGGDPRRALESEGMSPVSAEALGRYGTGQWVSYPSFVPVELEQVAGAPHEAAFLRGLGRRVFRSSVLQPYWGVLLRVPLVLRPATARLRLAEVLDSASATEFARAAVLGGFDRAEGDFRVQRTTMHR